ncbi:MAG: type I DNA topoisomerase [Ruminococcaceae bacterium]|nr:type I DNA topoisomerase [Oscillospiraceae bacterium]
MNTLIIVESPYKVPTIKSYLGKGYKVTACKGHVRDLPKSKLGVDIENDFAPDYINIRGKGDLIKELKKEAKSADRIYLATDPDREGEAIAWHLSTVLGNDGKKIKRITFNEVTKKALKEAVSAPRDIDMKLVDAQQARRILDRLVGYKISPFLWKKLKSGLSAGRVQSVATRLVVEREQEIREFVPKEYWTVSAKLAGGDDTLVAKYYGDINGKKELNNEASANAVVADCQGKDFAVESVKKALKRRKPMPPFTTSTLQQEANRRLNFQSKRTMMVAQELYEGVNLGEAGMRGLITYMRTDSLRISEDATQAAKEFIVNRYGEKYYPSTPNVFKSKKNSQDAHEAIRPTDPALTPETVKGKLSNDQYKLYKLVWERFIASQMRAAEFDTVVCDISCGQHIFRAGGYVVRFAGYMSVYDDRTEENDNEDGFSASALPVLNEGQLLKLEKMLSEQHFTQPPARYTEGTLTKVLEEKGIGRPSTFLPTITTITSRGYVKRNGKVLVPTEIGEVTTKLLLESFPSIIDYNYTAEMEDDLEKICSGDLPYVDVLKDFYVDFAKQLSAAEETLAEGKIAIAPTETDIICEKCGCKMVERVGKFGKFAGCPNYPTCKNTKPLDAAPEAPKLPSEHRCPTCGKPMYLRKGMYGSFFACEDYPTCKTTMTYRKDIGVPCPKCGKMLVVKQTKSKKTFYSCEDYPKCDFSSWDVPQERKCPSCGGLVLKKKNKEQYECYAKCGWSESK